MGPSVKSEFWWHGQPGEKFWLTVVSDERLGPNALPQYVESVTHFGQRKRKWAWNLITELRPNDVVFFWCHIEHLTPSNEDPAWAIVGFAKATSVVEHTTRVIDIRDFHLHYLDSDRSVQVSRVRLSEHMKFLRPLAFAEIQEHEDLLKRSRDQIRVSTRLSPYGPWTFSEERPMGISEGSVFKLPAWDVHTLELMHRACQSAVPDAETGVSERSFNSANSTDSWRSRRLADGESLPISQVKNSSLDAVVKEMITHVKEWDEQGIVALVQEFFGIKKITAQLKVRVHESLLRLAGSSSSIQGIEI